MGSFLQALGSLGQDVGDAGQVRKQNKLQQDQLGQEKLRTGFEGQRVKNENLRLLLEKQKQLDTEKTDALNQQFLTKQLAGYGWDKALRIKQGDGYLEINPVTAERRTISKEEYDAAHAKDKPLQSYELRQDKSGRFVYLPKDPTRGDKSIPSDVVGRLARVGAGAGPSGGAKTIADYAKDIQSGSGGETLKDVPQKLRGEVSTYMREHGMNAKRKLGVAEQKQANDIQTVEPLIADMKSFIEQNKLQHSGEGVSGIKDRAKAGIAWAEYTAGLPPSDPQLGRLIQLAAALKIKGAAPLVSAIGRSKYSYEQIVQHLPSPTDTPALLYKKVMFLSQLLNDSKSALKLNDNSDAAPPFGGATQSQGKTDPVVEQLLKKHGFN